MTAVPPCIHCELGSGAYPCRPAGNFDPARLAASYGEHVLRDRSEGGAGGAHWSFGCLDHLISEAPEMAWDVIVEHLQPRLTTAAEAGMLAAGPLEDLVAQHGETFIDRIEALAGASQRWRFILSGVWSQGEQDTDVWCRVVKARAAGPNMDKGEPLPPIVD